MKRTGGDGAKDGGESGSGKGRSRRKRMVSPAGQGGLSEQSMKSITKSIKNSNGSDRNWSSNWKI